MATFQLESSRFGTIEIPEDIVLTFEQGMIGFPDLKRYAILKQRDDSVFMWLQSLDDGSLAFPIVLPWVFYRDYEVNISDADMQALGVERADEIAIYCVVNVGGDVRSATINLFSPIVVNNQDRHARQLINTIEGYSTRDRLFQNAAAPTPVAMHEADAPNVTVLSPGR